METEANISFAGCGFIGIYHLGVSACLKKFAPHLLQNKIGGSSAGAMCAVALVCDLPLENITRNVAMLAYQSNEKMLGPFTPSFSIHQIIKSTFEELLPDDVAQRVRERLFVSLTKASNKSNILVSDFYDKTDLIDALCASSFVPVMSGFVPPKFRGEFAIDGGYSDNIPDLGGFTITVSPFAGDASIGPTDDNFSSLLLSIPHGSGGSLHLSTGNMRRFGNAMLPPDTNKMELICSQGFRDAMNYLQSKHLIRCQKCCDENQFIVISDLSEENQHCDRCIEKKEDVKDEELPKELVDVFDEIREMESKREVVGLGTYILSLPSMLASSTMTSTTCFMTSTVVTISQQRRAVEKLLRITLTPIKTLRKLQPSIQSCPFVNF